MGNYQLLKHEILDALLVGKSTSALSRKLGYSFDQVRRWKNGTKHFRWSEFCELCEAVKAPLPETMRDLFGLHVVKKKDLHHIVAPLKNFTRVKSTAAMAKQHAISLSVMKRYVSGATSPDFEFVLELIDQRAGFLKKFCDSITKRSDPVAPESIFSVPWFSAVSSAMALKKHLSRPRHSSEWIAGLLGLTVAQVNLAIERMVSAGLIEKGEAHYQPTLARTIAIGGRINVKQFAETMRFWTKRAADRYATLDGLPIASADKEIADLNRGFFRSFATDKESAAKVSSILTRTEQEIHEVLTASTAERTELRVIVIHHFAATDHPNATKDHGSESL